MLRTALRKLKFWNKEDKYLFPVTLLPLLCEVNRLLTCGGCGGSLYVRNEVSHIDDPDLIFRYEIRCRYTDCRRRVWSTATAMDAEEQFERVS